MKELIGLYLLLYLRPEVFIIAAAVFHKSSLEVFLTVFLWTTFNTWLTYFLVGVVKNKGEKAKSFAKFRKTKIGQTLTLINAKINKLNKSIIGKSLGLGQYLILIPFAFPLIPGIDTASVITAKLIKLKYAFWLFVLINLVKILLIMAPCYHWFK